MDWFIPSFPVMAEKGVDRFLTGYEACDMARPFLKGKWEQLSVLEVLLSQGCDGVGKATRFFSHSQAEPVLDSMFALFGDVRLFSPEALYFLDVVSIRQLAKGDFKPESVSAAIMAIGYTVLMCYPIGHPLAMTRLWCVFEIAASVLTDTKMHCAPEAPNTASFDGFIEHIGNAVKTMREITVDLENCSARDEADKS